MKKLKNLLNDFFEWSWQRNANKQHKNLKQQKQWQD